MKGFPNFEDDMQTVLPSFGQHILYIMIQWSEQLDARWQLAPDFTDDQCNCQSQVSGAAKGIASLYIYLFLLYWTSKSLNTCYNHRKSDALILLGLHVLTASVLELHSSILPSMFANCLETAIDCIVYSFSLIALLILGQVLRWCLSWHWILVVYWFVISIFLPYAGVEVITSA